MKRLTDDQINLIAIIEKSILKLEPLEREARRCNLRIIEHDLKYLRESLQHTLDLQCRAFRDDSLVDPLLFFPQSRFPFGKP